MPIKYLYLLLSFCLLSACGGENSKTENNKTSILITNIAPSAVVSSDFSANENSAVELSGMDSSDSDGTIISYQWKQSSGPAISLIGADKIMVTFDSPEVEQSIELTFELTVTDDNGASDTDTIIVTILNVNKSPVASSKENYSADENTTQILDGSSSTDPDGTISNYLWFQTSGPTVAITDADHAIATFITPNVNAATTLDFELTITDNEGAISTTTSTVNVLNIITTANVPPIAKTNSNFRANENTLATLNGSSSYDPDGVIVHYSWSQISGSTVTMNNPNSAIADFSVPAVSADLILIFKLSVTDDKGATHSRLMTVVATDASTSSNTHPKAIAAANYTADQGTVQILDGSRSLDSDGTIASYLWTQIAGKSVELNNANQAIAVFTTPDVETNTDLTFQLLVTDDKGSVDTASITVTVNSTSTQPPQPPATLTAVTANSINAYENSVSILDGSSSGGTIASYLWTQISGSPTVTINSANTAIARFSVPTVITSSVLTFTLTVTDDKGNTDSANLTATLLSAPTTSTYYISDCSNGSDVNCVLGDDNNDGRTPGTAWRTYDKAQNQFSALNMNDSIFFARGGSFIVTGGDRWVNTNSTAAAPVTIADYTPSWASGGSGKPIITLSTSSTDIFDLADAGAANAEFGYTFKNLDLRCIGAASTSSSGFWMANDVNNVIIEGVSVDGCRIGINSASSNVCASGDVKCNGINDDITLSAVTVTNSAEQGFFGHTNNLVIENSDFIGNGNRAVFDHNIYISGGNNLRISGNTLYQSDLSSSGVCLGVSLVVHGTVDNLLIDNNTIYEDIGKAGGGCWGIAVDPGYTRSESFSNITIRGNQITNMGGVSIGVASCNNCIIENNTISQYQTSFFNYIISAPNRSRNSNDALMTDITIQGNSIYLGAGTKGVAITLGTEGTNHQVLSNKIQYDGSDIFNCLHLSLSLSAYSDVDHNICSYENTTRGNWEKGTGDLAAWQGTGFGLNSQYLVLNLN